MSFSKMVTITLISNSPIERDLEFNRGNKKLLEKLVEISKGKHVSEDEFKSKRLSTVKY